jgi:hypothetical protein
MAIKLVAGGKRLTNIPNDVVYTVPGDCISSTVASGTVENLTVTPAVLTIKLVGPTRSLYVINGKQISTVGSPLVLPPMSLNAGEHLEAWTTLNEVMDIALTIGEQR